MFSNSILGVFGARPSVMLAGRFTPAQDSGGDDTDYGTSDPAGIAIQTNTNDVFLLCLN